MKGASILTNDRYYLVPHDHKDGKPVYLYRNAVVRALNLKTGEVIPSCWGVPHEALLSVAVDQKTQRTIPMFGAQHTLTLRDRDVEHGVFTQEEVRKMFQEDFDREDPDRQRIVRFIEETRQEGDRLANAYLKTMLVGYDDNDCRNLPGVPGATFLRVELARLPETNDWREFFDATRNRNNKLRGYIGI